MGSQASLDMCPLGQGSCTHTHEHKTGVQGSHTVYGGGIMCVLEALAHLVLIWGFHLFAGGEDPRTEGPTVTPWMGQGHGDCHPHTRVGAGPQPHFLRGRLCLHYLLGWWRPPPHPDTPPFFCRSGVSTLRGPRSSPL